MDTEIVLFRKSLTLLQGKTWVTKKKEKNFQNGAQMLPLIEFLWGTGDTVLKSSDIMAVIGMCFLLSNLINWF